MVKVNTLLLPKNDQTNHARNYTLIFLQNIILKLYTGCINQFFQKNCQHNNIRTTEQAGGKNEVWGCFEQLFVNKRILEEITENRYSLITKWLDYPRAFDSLPHKWLINALEPANIPEKNSY